MANVLTDLAADIYKSADMVGRELTGAISSVMINADGSERVALNGTIRSHFTRQPSATVTLTPSMTIPEGTDQTVDNKTMTISKSKGIQIPWTGEDVKHVDNGSGFETIYGDQITQAMRTITNEIETDLCTALYQGGSRSVGTAGTTPFSANFDIIAQARQILVDNGQSPAGDTSLVINTLAGTNLRNLAQLQKVNESGNDRLLRQGVLLDLQEMMLKESAQVQAHTVGGITGTVTVTGVEPIGETTINLTTAAASSVEYVAGDILSLAGDTNQYIIAAAVTIGASTTGNVVIQSPGLRQATAGSEAITEIASFTGNFAVRRGAAELAMRAPAMPKGGDAADDALMVQDPFSGLVFEIRSYKGFSKAMIQVAAAWGQKVWKPDGIALLLG